MNATYIHHIVIHFPIALLVIGAGAYVMALVHAWYGWRVIGGVALLAGTAAALVAVVAGLVARERTIEAGISSQVVNLHQLSGIVTLGLAALASAAWLAGAVRRRLNTTASTALVAALAVVSAASVSVAGHFGGSMLHPGLSPFPEVRELAGVEPRSAAAATRDDFDRGQTIYADTCAACHGPEGQGVPAVGGPPVFGQDALAVDPPADADRERRFETGLDVLDYVGETMPLDDPGALERDEYREVVRYLLYRRGLDVPPELTDRAARDIRLD